MHLSNSVSRSVSVRLDADEQFEHKGVTYPRDRVFKAHIRNIAVTGYDDTALEDLTFTLEGYAINSDGSQGMVQRRYQYTASVAYAILPSHVFNAIVQEFDRQHLTRFLASPKDVVHPYAFGPGDVLMEQARHQGVGSVNPLPDAQAHL